MHEKQMKLAALQLTANWHLLTILLYCMQGMAPRRSLQCTAEEGNGKSATATTRAIELMQARLLCRFRIHVLAILAVTAKRCRVCSDGQALKLHHFTVTAIR
jgi:hypothetical protein